MKHLNKFPRKISAKFCWQRANPENAESSQKKQADTVPYVFEDDLSQKEKTVMTEFQQQADDAKILANIESQLDSNDEIKVNLENVKNDSALINNAEARENLSGDIAAAGSTKIGKLFRGFFAKNELALAMEQTNATLASVGDRPGILPKGFDPEDYDYEEA